MKLSLQELTTTSPASQCPSIQPPGISYTQCMWNSMVSADWNLSHYTFEELNGEPRHMVRASHMGSELVCTAGEYRLALQVIYREFLQLQGEQTAK